MSEMILTDNFLHCAFIIKLFTFTADPREGRKTEFFFFSYDFIRSFRLFNLYVIDQWDSHLYASISNLCAKNQTFRASSQPIYLLVLRFRDLIS